MSSKIESYPLQWPLGWERSKTRRKDSLYQVDFAKARDEAVREVRLMKGTNIVVSSNLMTRRDGLPLANQRTPDDTGIALYWSQAGEPKVIACDAWSTPRDNMRAIGLAVEGLRTMMRSGASGIMTRGFAGFAQLPASTTTERKPASWRTVLGLHNMVNLTMRDVNDRVRELTLRHHPDHGGDVATMTLINVSRDEARAELEGKKPNA